MKSISVFGGSKIGQRSWRPGKKVWSLAIFGGCDMDFRQAELEEGTTKIVAISILGGNKVIVPQDLPISLCGFSFLGGREMKRSKTIETPAISAKVLHINAISILGGFEVTE